MKDSITPGLPLDKDSEAFGLGKPADPSAARKFLGGVADARGGIFLGV